MIDNFNKILPLLDANDDQMFYFGQIMSRRKDNPSQSSDNRIIKDVYVGGPEELLEKKEEIVGLCNYFNARFYLNVNQRNEKAVAFEMLRILGDRISREEYHRLKGIYATAAGQKHSAPKDNKKWIVDVDVEDIFVIDAIRAAITLCRPDPESDKVITQLPTPNGVHLITRPFDIKQFDEFKPKNKEISIQKNNPTLVWAP